MTWLQFKTAVKELITVDGSRQGITSYVDRMIKLGVVEVLSHVEFYTKGNITKYNLAGPEGFQPLTTEGNASLGQLPSDARPQEAYRIFYATAAIAARPPTDDEGCNRTPVVNYSYANRNDLICAHPLINDGASVIAIGKSGDFYIYPQLDRNEVLQIHWDGFTADHQDSDTVSYDEPMAECVGEYVKAKVTREVDKDLKLFESYYATFQKKRQELYLNSFGRQVIRTNPVGGSTSLACSTTTCSTC